MRDGAQPQFDPKAIGQKLLSRALRQVIGPRTQRRRRLHAGANAARRHSWGQLRPCRFATNRTDQLMPLIHGDVGLDRRDLGHLVPLGLRILPLPGG